MRNKDKTFEGRVYLTIFKFDECSRDHGASFEN